MPFNEYPYLSAGSMDLTAPYTIFSYRASCPGSGACVGENGSILIIGDSITNHVCDNYNACGQAVLKFGVNGMKAHDVLPWCSMLVERARPRVIVVALGTNDIGNPANLDSGLGLRWYFEQDYRCVASYLAHASGIRPVLMTLPPCEAGAPGLWGDLELRGWASDYIASVGAAQGCQVVDFRQTYPGIEPVSTNGLYAAPGFCAGDPLGIHPFGPAIKKIWAYFELAVERGLGQ